jgi:hypothetical protein
MALNTKTNMLNAALFSLLFASFNSEAMASKEEISETKSKPKTLIAKFSDPVWVKSSGKILFETILFMPGYTLKTGTNTFTFKLPITNCINNFKIEDLLDLTQKSLKDTVTVEYDANTTGNLGDPGLFAYKFRQNINQDSKLYTFILNVAERKLEERKLSVIEKDKSVINNDGGNTTTIEKRRSKSEGAISTLKEEVVKNGSNMFIEKLKSLIPTSETEQTLTPPKNKKPTIIRTDLKESSQQVNISDPVKKRRTPPKPPIKGAVKKEEVIKEEVIKEEVIKEEVIEEEVIEEEVKMPPPVPSQELKLLRKNSKINTVEEGRKDTPPPVPTRKNSGKDTKNNPDNSKK